MTVAVGGRLAVLGGTVWGPVLAVAPLPPASPPAPSAGLPSLTSCRTCRIASPAYSLQWVEPPPALAAAVQTIWELLLTYSVFLTGHRSSGRTHAG